MKKNRVISSFAGYPNKLSKFDKKGDYKKKFYLWQRAIWIFNDTNGRQFHGLFSMPTQKWRLLFNLAEFLTHKND